jgi:hypothetical protein
MLLMAGSVYGQVPLEDYACRTNLSVTKGNPTLITCDEEHGFDKGHASAWLRVIAEPQSGDTFTIGTTRYRFLADANWGSCQANDIRIPAAGEAGWSSTTRLYNMSNAAHDAINAASTGWYYDGTNYLRRDSAGVEYCAGTTAHPDVEAWFRPNNKFLIRAKTAGVAGAGISLSSSDSSRLFWAGWNDTISTNQTRHYWFVHIQGGTGNWSSMNRYTNQFGTGNNLVWQAYSTAPNAFAINFASNSITGPTPAAGTLKINRADAGAYPFVQTAGQYSGPWITETFGPGYFQIAIPSCTAQTPIADCHKGYSRFSNDKYGYRKSIQNFTVSSGVAEVWIDKWDDAAAVTGGYEALTVGTPVFVAGFKHLTALGTQYAEAAKFHTCGTFADLQTCGMVRLTGVDQSNASYTVIRFDTALPDGTYTGSCANSACLPFATAHVGSAFRAHPYVYYKPLFTTSNTRFFPLDSPSFHAKGTTPEGVNRIRFFVKTQKNLAQGNSGYNVNLGTFPTAPSAIGNTHFYHYSALDFYADRWMLIEYNNTPSHQVDGPNGANWWENPTSDPGHVYGNQWRGSYPGAPAKTMTDHQTTFYFDGNGRTYTQTSAGGLGWSGQTVLISSLMLDKVENEPEEFVQGRAGAWAPQRYLNRDTTLTASPGYCAYFSGPVTYDVSYRLRYATSSIKTLGWSNAVNPGTQPYRTSTDGNVLPGFKWCSPPMAEEVAFFVGIRPIIPVLGYSWDGTQHWFSTRNAVSMKVGDALTVTGTGTGADGSRTITAVAPRKIWFRFEPTHISSTWTTPSKLTSIVAADESSGRVCTVNLTEAHGLSVGWKVEVVNTTNDVLGGTPNPSSPKIYAISAVPDANSFKFPCPGVPVNTYNTDRSSNMGHMAVMAMPGIAVAGGGATTWNNSGTIESAEENKNFAEINLSPYQGVVPATTSGLPHRLGGFTTSTGAILFYYAPSAAACSLTVSGSGTFSDAGGVRARVQVVSNLSPLSLYTFALNCGSGEALANGLLITNASNAGNTQAVTVSASMPVLATGGPDNLVVDYGPAPNQLNQSANVSCAGGRCSATLNLASDTTVWLRRRWCRNGVTDPACANNGNEVARSVTEPVNVR